MQKNNQDGNIKKITVDTFNIHRYFFLPKDSNEETFPRFIFSRFMMNRS